MDQPHSKSRRQLVGAATAAGAMTAIGFPAIVRSQSDVVRLGHLTPLTGFLGPLGEYAVMGVKLAVDEINAAGGINGRKVDLISEDSVNPQTASTKAERLIERDKVVAIVGEISSASGLAIAQVAQRNKILFFNTGCNSDELRGKSCNRFMFHTEAANSMYVGAAGQALLRDGLVKGKKWYSVTADYAFGHDLLRVAKRFMLANGGEFAADELVATNVTDFSPYLLKIRNAKPDLVVSNLAGAQITNFMKQYMEFGLPFPLAGFGFDTAVAWGAGKGNVAGIWRAPVEGGEETLILDTHKAGHWSAWTVVEQGIYFLTAESLERPVIEFFSFTTGRITEVAALSKPFRPWTNPAGLSVSADGRWMLFTQEDRSDMDIMLVENFR
jgi:branched-chain amino acid transport system substrate-binding protein